MYKIQKQPKSILQSLVQRVKYEQMISRELANVDEEVIIHKEKLELTSK
jgi:uncharacterized protein YihD (DUF1040 family)